jgi:regulator of sigma E protease
MSWFISLLVLSGLIFFHELGHFLAARLVGVHVEVFSIGFGKKLFSFKRWETQWSVSAIPLGGYVKMKGQDDRDPTNVSYDNDSYTVKTPIQKIFILVAGPLANFVVAFFLYFIIALGGPMAISPIIGEIVKDSPASQAKLQKNDIIKSINNKQITTWKEMAKIISISKGSLDIVVKRGAYLEHKLLIPKLTTTKNMYGDIIEKKMIGIGALGVTHKLDLDFLEKFGYAKEQIIFASTMIFTGLQKLVVGEVPAKELGGVIGIVKITSDASAAGWMSVLFLAGLISVNLGMLNLLPIPALDGGHIMFNFYELITKKAPSETVLTYLTMAGWVLLLMLMGLGMYNDINRIIG